MQFIYKIIVALGLIIPLVDATAQPTTTTPNYPNRPIKIVVPFPPGGGTDILTRLIGQRMSADWGQPVVIENRPGANTGIGAQLVARATPDGYTLLAAMDVTMVMNPVTHVPMNYDPLKDFTPITLLAKNGTMLVVRASDGPKSVRELIAKGKANPDKLNYGGGVTIARLGGFMVAKVGGFKAEMVPYKGSADTLQGLLSGAIDYAADGNATSLPLVKSGQLRALAKLNDRPFAPLPNLPSMAVAMGVPHFDEISAWTAFYAPADTPAAIVDKVQKEVAHIYADPAIAAKLEKLGITAVSSTASELGAFQRSELARWTKVFKDNNLKF